jgi:FAD/FMN-containing dehydrogenase
LASILQLMEQHGYRWFLPVSPGTKFATLGGAIANDVHGKNHHRAGTFGCHVLSLELVRSDGRRLVCSPTSNADLFRATVAGLGLTGIIASAQLQMAATPGPMLETESKPFESLAAFFDLSSASDREWDYTVAWFDSLADEPRGVFSRARHVESTSRILSLAPRRMSLPFDLPSFVLGERSVRTFNALYWRRASARQSRRTAHYESVLYPLDGIRNWNRMYGKRGFHQYQCVIPAAVAPQAVGDLLRVIAREKEGSFLTVLKTFGHRQSPGLLSFPMAGTTVALDFPNRGQRTFALLDRLDAITRAAGGRLYPAKDSHMSAAMFADGYPNADTYAAHVDPSFSSSFWRRVAPAVRP